MATVGNHQQGAFSSPINGQAADATVVLANDNANRTTTNAHDADATIHIQSSVLASRPAAGTAQRVWITTDGLRAYVDSGSVWGEFAYLSLAAGGTVAGAVSVQALTATQVTSSGAVTVTGNSGAGVGSMYIDATDGITIRGRTGSSYDFTVATASAGYLIRNPTGTANLQIPTGSLTVGNGVTVTGGVTANAAAPFVSTNPSAASLHQVLSSSGTTTGAVSLSLANTGNSQLIGIESSAGGTLYTGTAAYSAVFGTASARSVHLVTNNSVRLTIDSAGATTISSSLTAGGNIVTSAGRVQASANGMFGAWDGIGDAGSLIVANNTAASASTGAATLPPAPLGFLSWKLGATTIKVPYYAN